MKKAYKPTSYNSLSPYLIVEDAARLVELLKKIFNASVLRRFEGSQGRIVHVELKIDDSVIMISDSTDTYPAHKTMLHVYVPDVFVAYERAISSGCTEIEKPLNKPGDPDTRGAFYDFAGNHWSVSTQMEE
jgi:PhnB protein